MKEKIPLNLDILKWARISIGYSIEDVAKKLGKKFKTEVIESWEEGNSSPTYVQLEKLANEIYKRPIALFFFPEIPSEESIKGDFRTLPDTITASLPPQLIKLYRKAKVFQYCLEELFENEKPIDKSIIDLTSIGDIGGLNEVVKEVRKILNISIEEQSKWNSVNIGFKKWREALEIQGVFIFKDAFRVDDYSGFCLYSTKYPLIYVNNSFPFSRQTFTLFHELAHLLFHKGGIYFRDENISNSFQGDYRNIEIFCNKFSNEFLVPTEIFNSFSLEVSESQFETIASFFSVSREVILRNYLDRGIIDKNYYEKMAIKWIEQSKQKTRKGIGNYYQNIRSYLGSNYVDLVLKKYYRNKISVETASEYLNIKVKNFNNFEINTKE